MIEANFTIQRGDFNLHFDEKLPAQKVTVISGKSGAGKTTLLRLMAGLDKVDNAKFIVKGQVFQQGDVFVPPELRNVAYVGQENRLLPFLSAEKNIAFAQKRRFTHYAPPNLSELIDVFDVSSCLGNLPETLSSGEKQRVSVIQLLVSCPKLFLFDEAFSAIDDKRKRVILDYLVDYLEGLGLPMIYVSHDEQEIASRIEKVIFL